MRRSTIALAVAAAVAPALLGACASTGTATGKLAEKELEAFRKLETRLDANRDALAGALTDLGEISAQAIGDRHSLSLSIAKAQLLESMKSPWTNPHPDLATTQKEVAFYHLYALAEAERELLEARLTERRAALAEVADAYDRLADLTAQIIAAEKIVIAHLKQPKGAQVSAFLGTLLGETRAFRQTLAASDNPELQALAARVGKAEDKVAGAQASIAQALAAAAQLKE